MLVVAAWVASPVLLLAGVFGFFLADPLDVPDEVLDVLDKRASVISMFLGLLFGGSALWLQLRAAPAGRPGTDPAGASSSGENSPVVGGPMSGGMVIGQVSGSARVAGPGSTLAEGPGATAIGTSTGPVTTGAHSPIVSGPVGTLVGGDAHFTTHIPGPAPRAAAGLPAAAAGFTGRADALAELLAFLNPSRQDAAGTGGTGVVVSAVAGMAGVGKTALALVAAHRAVQAGWFTGGVYFIDMRGYTPHPAERVEAGAAAGQLARAMGVRDPDLPPTGEERLGLYRSLLDEQARLGRPVLVVADNATTGGQVEPLLPAQACHRLLVTSRHTLSLPARPLDLSVLEEAEALDLLHTALNIRHLDARVRDEPQAASDIVRLCGLLPLALEIIAALLAAEPGRPLSGMADELSDASERLNVLQVPDQEPGRPKAVRAAFDLSYQRLAHAAPKQARLFRLLPTAPGPDLSTSAAAALDGRPESSVRRDLRDLAAAHLITSSGGERWGMHDLVRLHASERGTQHAMEDGSEEALDRLLEHYLQLAGAANDHVRALPGRPAPAAFTGRADALAWFDTERAGLIAAVVLAEATGRYLLAATLPACLNPYLDWRRHLDDLPTINTLALTASRHLRDRHSEGQALNNLGLALQQVRRFEEAITAHQQDLHICRELGDHHREGTALNNLGLALQEVRRFEEAITAHQDAAAIYRELGDRHSEGRALNNLGTALQEVRRFEEAITAHQQDLHICRELGDRHSEGRALNNLGTALREVRRFEEAITAHQDAAAIYRELGDRHREGTALNNLGLALQEVRRFEEAITAHQDAAAIFGELGDRHSEGQALNNLGLALQEVRRFEEAITAHQDAAAIFRELGDRHSEGRALNNLGTALREVRRFEEAITAHQQDLHICRELGDRHSEGRALNNLGTALREVRRFEEAITALQGAAAIFGELGDRHSEGRALNNLGLALLQVRRFEEAITALQDAAAIFRELGDRHSEGQALNNLGLALHQGRFEEAITAHQAAAAIFGELGDRHSEGTALNNLGLALRQVRRFEEAITAQQDAAAIFESLDDGYSLGIVQANLEEGLRQQAES